MSKIPYRIVLLIGVLSTALCQGPAAASAPPPARIERMVIDTSLAHLNMAPYVSYYEDKTGTLDFEQIRSTEFEDQFRHRSDDKLNFGYTRSVYWLRFSTINPMGLPMPWYLEYTYAPIDHLTLFIPTGTRYRRLDTGDRLPFDSRAYAHRTFVFPLKDAPGPNTYYIRLQSDGPISAPLIAWSPDVFNIQKEKALLILGMYYGVMLAMALYNLFIFVSVRERVFLYLVCFISGTIGFSLNQSGLGFQFLWPQATAWNNMCNPLFIFIGCGFALQFTRSFLSTYRYTPRLNRLLGCLVAVGVIALPFTLFAPYYAISPLSVLYAALATLLMICAGIVHLFKGHRTARYYVISWALFLLGLAVFILRISGLVSVTFLSEWGYLIGMALLVLMLSIGLADKINTIRNEREKALSALDRPSANRSSNIMPAGFGPNPKSERAASLPSQLPAGQEQKTEPEGDNRPKEEGQ